MGYTGVPLDTGSAMVAAIALGISVDHTMHFMVRYNQELVRHRDEAEAIGATRRAELRPITAASVALALGFAVLVFSSFPPIARFGALVAMVILLAFAANLFLTPALLANTRLVTLWDLLSIRVRQELLRRCSLLHGMRLRQIRRVILMGQVRSHRAGDAIMRAGDAADDIFVLLDGKARLFSAAPGDLQRAPRTLAVGDVFGLTAVATLQPRIATAVATCDAKVLMLSRDALQHGARRYPRVAYQLFRNLSTIFGQRLSEHLLAPAPLPVMSPRPAASAATSTTNDPAFDKAACSIHLIGLRSHARETSGCHRIGNEPTNAMSASNAQRRLAS